MSNPKHRILIIEDEALVAHELKGRLQRMGYDVVGVAYGSEALNLARETLPDLLLTDIHLKNGEDGIDMALAIQQERQVPVVFLTAYSDEETVSRAKAVTPYGFIIKPVDHRELQIAIDLAMYNFNIERELRETQQLLQNALACIGNALVFVDAAGRVSQINADAQRLLAVEQTQVIGQQWHSVFSLPVGSSVHVRITSALNSSEVSKLPAFILNLPGGLARLVDGIVGPMLPGGVLILRELSELGHHLEALPTPRQLLSSLGPEQLGPSESTMCQLAIAVQVSVSIAGQTRPLDVSESRVLLEVVAQRLNQVLRATDLVSVLGDAQVSVCLPYTNLAAGKNIAQTVLQTLNASRFEPTGLSFSIGLAQADAGDQQPFELFRRANWALNVAQESGGDRVIAWSDASEKLTAKGENQAAKRRGYHNVVLLWNLMSLVMKAASAQEMSNLFCQHLLESFELVEVAVLRSQAHSIESLGGALQKGHFKSLADLDFNESDLLRVTEVLHKRKAVHFDATFVLPVSSRHCLYLKAKAPLDAAELDFLANLINYFATGLRRFEHPAEDEEPVSTSALIYQSPQMRELIESCRLVAPTDATVLITGESGTGKELLARTIHEMSPRADKPFIIVDCGAVVGSLMESELFGHVKGAFTGAEKHFSGRLKEAQGGTVLLDEVGELSLEMQVKLLRYVQDRQIVAVGSKVYETIDTRILAATNKDLKGLVDRGEFREDLFYRLNVFAIESPALRDRPADIPLLADHYLKVYAQRYAKRISGFTEEAEQALSDYRWPGNIRELVNVINRGVILCKGSQVNSIHLGLFPNTKQSSLNLAPTAAQREETLGAEVLSGWMKNLVTLCLANPEKLPPLGAWLEEDLILACLASNGDVTNRAAQSLGIPESTLRRKVARIREVYDTAETRRPAGWPSVIPLMDSLTELALSLQKPLLELVAQALMNELESRPISRKDAALLQGVSLPTYRRLRSNSPQIADDENYGE